MNDRPKSFWQVLKLIAHDRGWVKCRTCRHWIKHPLAVQTVAREVAQGDDKKRSHHERLGVCGAREAEDIPRLVSAMTQGAYLGTAFAAWSENEVCALHPWMPESRAGEYGYNPTKFGGKHAGFDHVPSFDEAMKFAHIPGVTPDRQVSGLPGEAHAKELLAEVRQVSQAQEHSQVKRRFLGPDGRVSMPAAPAAPQSGEASGEASPAPSPEPSAPHRDKSE